jgi:inositol polyphosphate-4-phosphatase
VTGLVARLWCARPDPAFLLVLSTLGPLVEFEGMLSYYGDEIAMWGDMVVAVEDLCTVSDAFIIIKWGIIDSSLYLRTPLMSVYCNT